MYEDNNMKTAKLFKNGRSQALRLPKNFQFTGNDVYIQKHGDAVILVPRDKLWDVFLSGLQSFSDDIFEEDRDQGKEQIREQL